jgi:hypothetical protein
MHALAQDGVGFPALGRVLDEISECGLHKGEWTALTGFFSIHGVVEISIFCGANLYSDRRPANAGTQSALDSGIPVQALCAGMSLLRLCTDFLNKPPETVTPAYAGVQTAYLPGRCPLDYGAGRMSGEKGHSKRSS